MHNVPDGLLRDPESFGEASERLIGIDLPNHSYIAFGEFRVRTVFTSTMRRSMQSGPPAVLDILSTTDVFEVLNAVVRLDAIAVVHLLLRFRHSQECQGNSTMNLPLPWWLSRQTDAKHRIAFGITGRRENSPALAAGCAPI